MNAYTHRFLTGILYIALSLGALLLWFNPSHKAAALILYGIFCALMLYHHNRFYSHEAKRPAGQYFLLVELIFALSIQYFDHTGFIELYLFILLGDAILAYSKRFSLPYVFTTLLGYSLMLYYKSGTPSLQEFWTITDATYMLTAIYITMLFIGRYNTDLLQEKHRSADAIKAQAKALEDANAKLQAYADELEETADLRAREALMRELHDKLGHQLTTASIGTQAARILVEKNPEAARERLAMVTEQLQEAMQSLREVISGNAAEAKLQPTTFLSSLKNLLFETQRRTGIEMSHNLELQTDSSYDSLSKQQQVFLYNALMEGLTNGIRHGKATAFEFHLLPPTAVSSTEPQPTEAKEPDELEEHPKSIQSNPVPSPLPDPAQSPTKHPYPDSFHFCLRDNGTGFNDLTPGFGLLKMQKEAQKLGAQLRLESAKGCMLEIVLNVNDQSALPPRQ